MSGSGLFFLKNGCEWVTFLEKLVGVGRFVKKWVGVGRFCRKMGGSCLFLLNNGWKWVRVAGIG